MNTPDPLSLCNACDAAPADPDDPAGYCAECRDGGEPPRSFGDLALCARDVQTHAHDLNWGAREAGRRAGVDRLAWQVERLAAQLAETCERLDREGR